MVTVDVALQEINLAACHFSLFSDSRRKFQKKQLLVIHLTVIRNFEKTWYRFACSQEVTSKHDSNISLSKIQAVKTDVSRG